MEEQLLNLAENIKKNEDAVNDGNDYDDKL